MQNDLSAEFISDLENFMGAINGCAYFLLGATTIGDQGFKVYTYDSASTATPNGDTVLNSIGMGGRYLRLNFFGTTGTASIATPSRTLNSSFTISTTKPATVTYSVTLQVTNPLLAGNSTASVFLEYSTNGGTTWLPVCQAVNVSSVALAVAVAIQNSQTSVLSGYIPANALTRLRSTTSGTAAVTFISGQEVTY